MKTSIQRSALATPARLGQGLVGAADELTSQSKSSAKPYLARLCILAAAALGALLTLSGCGATGSLTFQRGPIVVGVTSDGKSVAANIRATDGKNVIDLQRNWRTAK